MRERIVGSMVIYVHVHVAIIAISNTFVAAKLGQFQNMCVFLHERYTLTSRFCSLKILSSYFYNRTGVTCLNKCVRNNDTVCIGRLMIIIGAKVLVTVTL